MQMALHRAIFGFRCVWVVIGLISSATTIARAQSASHPGAAASQPTAASPGVAAPAVGTTGNSLEDRLRRMEQVNERIQRQYDALLKKYDDLSHRVESGSTLRPGNSAASTTRMDGRVGAVEYQQPPSREARAGQGAQGTGGRTNPERFNEGGLGAEGMERAPFTAPGGLPVTTGGGLQGAQAGISTRGAVGMGAQGTGGRTYPPESTSVGSEKIPRRIAKVEFAEGLELSSPDDEFKLTFHNLTQAEFRGFPNNQQGILQSQFFIPRQRWYFTGRVTRNVEFYTVINRGYGSLDLLDAFITYRIDQRFRLRAGRMKTPYLYEYYSIAEGDLIAPERSLYAGNMAANRQMGMMALGEVFDGRLGYSVGVYNGPRRSFQDFNSAKDVIGYLNARPFLKSERYKALNYLNIGGSWDVGYQQDSPTQPNALRTANDQSPNAAAVSLSPTWMTFNNNVVEQGQRIQWAGHLIWYYKSFTFLAEYGGGVAGYALNTSKTSTYIPYNGYMVQGTYFITGEQLTRRVSVVKPLRDFSWVKGKRAPGAIEVHGRFSTLGFGKEVFTAGFVDPNLWSNQAWATDVGFNWYLNFYTKVMVDWQHSDFYTPVVIGPNHFGPNRDLFWLRFQVFF
jgi:phosphate-selective porin OprO and OprP